MHKVLAILFLSLFTLLALPVHAHDFHHAKSHPFPNIIPLPNGFQPEGVVRGHGSTAYVGSLLGERIYQVDLRTGEGELLANGASDSAIVGMAYDKRSNYIFAAGGPYGTVNVFNAKNGDKITQFQFADADTFVNDGIVTRDAAYFTDSFAPVIYRIPLSKKGHLPSSGEIISLDANFEFVPGAFNANGIVKGKKRGHLIVVNSATGKLYDVDGKTGATNEIDLGGASVPNGDGLHRRGDRLYVVQNFLNQIVELELSDDGLSATTERIITSPDFRIPTTVTIFGNSLYAVNARFDVAPPPFFGGPADPDLEFELVRVRVAD